MAARAPIELLPGAYVDGEIVVYGDEGYTLPEWAEYLRSRRTDRKPSLRVVYTDDERRAYKAEWMRQRRANPEYREHERLQARARDHGRHRVGSLHDLGCTGPTKTTGCRCHKSMCYDRP